MTSSKLIPVAILLQAREALVEALARGEYSPLAAENAKQAIANYDAQLTQWHGEVTPLIPVDRAAESSLNRILQK